MATKWLQYWSGELPQEFDLARQWHAKIAAQAGVEYVFLWDLTQRYHTDRTANWGKVALLNEFLHDAPDGERILYMDCDALVVHAERFAEWLRAPWPELALAPVCASIVYREGPYNVGVAPMLACDPVRRLWREVAERAVSRRDHRDQVQACYAVATAQREHALQFAELDPKYNDYQYGQHACANGHQVIRAWHGIPQDRKLSAMYAALVNLGAA